MRALVTGVTRGIGRSLVDHLVGEDWDVVAVARNGEALHELADGWGDQVTPHVADVTDADSLGYVVAASGQLDLVVANAGALTGTGVLWESDPQEWWSGVEVNLRGVYLTAHAVLPDMVARGAGRLVLVTSGIGNAPGPWNAGYASSKAAVTVLGESLEHELGGTGVHCFLVSPGMVATDMTRFPETLTRHRPDLADIASERFTPVERVLALVDAIAGGRLDGQAGRFLHATDDLDALLAAWDPTDDRARTLRLAPAYDADPVAG
jgi:NAD(P)-dependent dehydrogenase (short-subunit alcohol dehydrogenase family)